MIVWVCCLLTCPKICRKRSIDKLLWANKSSHFRITNFASENQWVASLMCQRLDKIQNIARECCLSFKVDKKICKFFLRFVSICRLFNPLHKSTYDFTTKVDMFSPINVTWLNFPLSIQRYNADLCSMSFSNVNFDILDFWLDCFLGNLTPCALRSLSHSFISIFVSKFWFNKLPGYLKPQKNW